MEGLKHVAYVLSVCLLAGSSVRSYMTPLWYKRTSPAGMA